MRHRSRTYAPAVLAAAVVAVSSLSGCGGDDADTASAAPRSPESAVSSGTPSVASPDADAEADSGPPFPADLSADVQEQSADAFVTVTGIRTGRHDGFDRVVFEVGGTGTPGWDVRYVDAATSQGSGDPVELAGAAVLQVTVTGAGYPYETGETEYEGPDPLAGAGTQVITEVAFDATFEGATVAFVGTTTEAPFRVQLMENPTRIVVDVRDPV